ncbi:hypothetical protein KXS11_17370 [Plantibacter flavus]|uniref:hypothetical protein n=1 Tax=Plantibacter flavus TaxID=150123 RepID=UPI003F18E978
MNHDTATPTPADSIGRDTGRYRFVLPPAWAHLPADEPVEAVVRRLIPSTGSEVGSSELAVLRSALRRQVRALRDAARASGGVDVLLPVAPRGGAVIPANVLVMNAPASSRAAYLDGRLPEAWAVPPVGGRPVTITEDRFGDLPVTRALRIDRESPDGEPVDLIRIEYFVPRAAAVPRALALVISCTVVGRVGPERLPQSTIEVLVALVDAIAHTFRWLDEHGDPIGP